MDKHFDILETTRANIIASVENLTLEQINKTPDNFNNNIAWNLGHIYVTQELLLYKLSGTPMQIDNAMIAKYAKGTLPSGDISQTELDHILNCLATSPASVKKDYNNQIFNEYKLYKTSYNFTLDSIETAISFNNTHEGLHFGYIMALKRMV